MSEPIKHQIISDGGKPLFVLVPYDTYIKNERFLTDPEPTIPHEVVKLTMIEGKSPVRAWREHKGLSQGEVARRLGITQGAYSQMEKPDANLRHGTLEKIAKALDVDPGQLDF